MYSLEELGGGMLVEAIKTHPKILLEGKILGSSIGCRQNLRGFAVPD
jgi:hypothetical protein